MKGSRASSVSCHTVAPKPGSNRFAFKGPSTCHCWTLFKKVFGMSMCAVSRINDISQSQALIVSVASVKDVDQLRKMADVAIVLINQLPSSTISAIAKQGGLTLVATRQLNEHAST